jgi:hypothetical protein
MRPLQNNVYVLVLTQGNTNAAAAFLFMQQVCSCARVGPALHELCGRVAARVAHTSARCRQVITLFKSYFNTFDEDSLRNNFVLIYELLDGASPCRCVTVVRSFELTAPLTPLSVYRTCAEVMDNGYPQILTPEALKLYITQQGVRSELAPFEIRVRAPTDCGRRVAFS